VSKSIQRRRLEIWFDSENESFIMAFMWNNISVKKVKQSRYRPGVAQRFPGS
jgi:hypothetical protein